MNTPTTREYLGGELKRLRVLAGLSGRELARRIGLSQSSVSRIESGLAAPDLPTVKKWARVVGATSEVRETLTQLTTSASTELRPWSGNQPAEGHLQLQFRDMEASARTLCYLQMTGVPGLLQTADYARHAIELTDTTGQRDIVAAVGGRLQRQALLQDEQRTFKFLIAESALRHPPDGTGQVLAQQMAHLAVVASRPNVSVGVIPTGAPTLPLLLGFVLFDDVTDGQPFVEIELLHTAVNVTGPDVNLYREYFAHLEESAVFGDEMLTILNDHS